MKFNDLEIMTFKLFIQRVFFLGKSCIFNSIIFFECIFSKDLAIRDHAAGVTDGRI